MRTPTWTVWDCDGGMPDVLGYVNDVLENSLGQVNDVLENKLGHIHDVLGSKLGGRGGHWERDFGFGRWGGGGAGAGAWGGWWPGPGAAAGGPGGPRGPRGSRTGRGDVRAAILALLKEGPRTGYQIMSDIKERSGGAWRPSPGAVYPALSQLADEGLIEGEESGGRRTFRLTPAGLDYLEQHPEMARAAWEQKAQAQQEADWDVPGLFAEAARLGGGIVQVAHSGTPAQVLAAERLLERTRRELYQILADDLNDEEAADEEAADDVTAGQAGDQEGE